eukprot:scaffold64286_cov24-Prasinocladus_malaysianus.AAC.1
MPRQPTSNGANHHHTEDASPVASSPANRPPPQSIAMDDSAANGSHQAGLSDGVQGSGLLEQVARARGGHLYGTTVFRQSEVQVEWPLRTAGSSASLHISKE